MTSENALRPDSSTTLHGLKLWTLRIFKDEATRIRRLGLPEEITKEAIVCISQSMLHVLHQLHSMEFTNPALWAQAPEFIEEVR